MGRPVVHWEFWSEDAEKASNRRYRMDQRRHHEAASGSAPAKLALYIDVDDLDVYGKRIKEAGGKILVEKMDVPGVGQLSLFEDPDGRVLGMWKQQK